MVASVQYEKLKNKRMLLIKSIENPRMAVKLSHKLLFQKYKKFNEIAHKINKNNKINLNGNINNFQNKNNKQPENKKIPLWKYIQSDINKTNNSSATSIINNKEIKKKIYLKK